MDNTSQKGPKGEATLNNNNNNKINHNFSTFSQNSKRRKTLLLGRSKEIGFQNE